MNKKKLISKCNYGTNRGGLVHHDRITPGTWGNRGSGNELESALENGLSTVWNGVKWVGDKVFNAGDYIDQGLAYMIGLIPGGMSAQESLENTKRSQNPQQDIFTTSDGTQYVTQYWVDTDGNEHLAPVVGIAPPLPTLPSNATPAMQVLFNDLKRQRFNWQVRESQLRKIGKADMMESTGTAKTYRRLEAELNKLIDAAKGHLNKTDNVKLNKKQHIQYKHSKYMASESQGKVGDLRVMNSGRPALKERQWDEVERVMRTDRNPKVQSMINQYDIKVKKGINKDALKAARKKMLEQYLDMMPGYFNYLRQ